MSAELAFGECEGMCGRGVTFPGWDRYCDECLQEMREEDAARDERMDEEDRYLYGI